MSDKTYMDVEDLEVYRMLCDLHLQVCDQTSNGLEKSLENHLPSKEWKWSTMSEDRPEHEYLMPLPGYPISDSESQNTKQHSSPETFFPEHRTPDTLSYV